MRSLVSLLLLFSCSLSHAKEVTDTLLSSKNDRVIITYDVTTDNSQVIVRFKDVSKNLGPAFRKKYDELNKVAVIFFDRTGNYKNYKFTGLNIETIKIPSNLKYTESEEGFHILRTNQMPTIKAGLRMDNIQSGTLDVPVYLAYYKEKKFLQKQSTYDVFTKCGVLKVKISKAKNVQEMQNNNRSINQTVITTDEIEGGVDGDDEEALGLANSVMSLLELQTKLPFDDELRSDFANLNKLSHKVKNQSIVFRVGNALEAYRSKQRELEDEEEKAKKDAEQKALEEAAKAKAEQDSIIAAQKEDAEKQQKRNMWMIIGGIILAVALFVGNQVMQTLRNRRTERITRDMAKRAEQEAKRQAQNRIRSQIRNTEYETRRKSKDMLNKGIGKIVNGKSKKNNGFKI